MPSVGKPGTLGGPLALSQRKERATVGPYAPKPLGYTRVTMRGTMGCHPVRGSQSPKPALSSDRGLKLALVKVESLVIAGHYPAVNTSLLLAHTARQATGVRSAIGAPLWGCRWRGGRLGLSRNKVAVGEPAARSPPKFISGGGPDFSWARSSEVERRLCKPKVPGSSPGGSISMQRGERGALPARRAQAQGL